MLRLDREHYDITDSTIALRVTPYYTKHLTDNEHLYISFGYNEYAPDADHWYYMDDKYLYIYIPYNSKHLDSYEIQPKKYIAFADLNELNAKPQN